MDASEQDRGAGDIPRDLEEARQRLADSIGSLINEVHPKAVAQRTIDEAKVTAQRTFEEAKATAQRTFEDAKATAQRTFEEAKAVAHSRFEDVKATTQRTAEQVKATATDGFQRLKSELIDDNGWRTDRIVAVAGGVLGVLTFVGIVRGVRR